MQINLVNTFSHRIAFHGLFGMLLMVCYPFQALYSGNQNIYFLWGMAKAGVGSLALDPLLVESDPFPLFSCVVYGVVKFLHPWIFHGLYWLVNCVYSYALFGIVNQVFDVYRRQAKMALLAALVLLMHTGALWGGFFRIMFDVDLSWVWDSGIAEQGVLRGYFQPSTSGVLLLLSVYFFLKENARGAFLTLSCAALFHANYVVIGAGIGIIYSALFILKSNVKPLVVLKWACVSVVILIPQLYYIATHFLPSAVVDGGALHQAVGRTQVGNIHLSPMLWISVKTLCQVSIMVYALWFFREKRIGILFMWLMLLFGLITIVTFISDSQTLLSLTPWRISALLVPIAVALSLGNIFYSDIELEWQPRAAALLLVASTLLASFACFRIFGTTNGNFIIYWKIASGLVAALACFIAYRIPSFLQRSNFLNTLALITSMGAIGAGILEMSMEQQFQTQKPEYGVIQFLQSYKSNDQVLLVPTDLTSIRINASSAVIADDALVHGLQLPSLLKRQNEVRDFYASLWSTSSLDAFQQRYAFNAIVVSVQKEIPKELLALEVYRDSYFRVLRF